MIEQILDEVRQEQIEQILDEVIQERFRQDKKWGANRALDTRTWITILGEEYGEVCRADLNRDLDNYRDELIQVAAVAVAAIESLDLSRDV